jgi:uncharacterized protein related to proFAR isomerase
MARTWRQMKRASKLAWHSRPRVTKVVATRRATAASIVRSTRLAVSIDVANSTILASLQHERTRPCCVRLAQVSD